MKISSRRIVRSGLRNGLILLAIILCISFAQVILFKYVNPPFTPLMLYRLAHREGMQYRWKPLSWMSPFFQQAVLASEDQRFLDHSGFDFNQINEALQEYADNKPLRGASTISMQVARNLFLWQGHSWIRKALEAYYTVLIELLWTKQRILETYLNVAEWGKGIFGAEAAAIHYFRCSASAVSREQAALLAAVLPNPRKWSPVRPTSFIMQRKAFILRYMNRFKPLRN
ncbi:MAG: monofunctional biosynthetic peptidoglycantransglycosylase [Deltaproteobacteria bacterium]|nr:monofunctional biosynthetic peptidoglycantransglycosylase [Deltaproteobacteria bacterium]